MVLISLEGVEISYAVKLEFKATNNQAEYKALFIRLTLALALQAERVKIQTDSQSVANHFNESFQVKDEKMKITLNIPNRLWRSLKKWRLTRYQKEKIFEQISY